MTDKILWGLWEHKRKDWLGVMGASGIEAHLSYESACHEADKDSSPRPLAIEIGAYEALRDALASVYPLLPDLIRHGQRSYRECCGCHARETGVSGRDEASGEIRWYPDKPIVHADDCRILAARAALAVADAVLTTCGEGGANQP